MTTEDFGKILSGILLGALEEEVSNVDVCIKDQKKMISELEEAVNDFKLETFKGVKSGIKEIGEVASQMSHDISECKSVVKNIEDLAKMAHAFSNPISLAYHVGKDLIINGKDIYKHINDSIT